MSEELRRAMQEAAGGQPPVADWVGPVRGGLRARARRRAVSQAAAGTAFAVAAAVLGVTVLGDPSGGTLVQEDVAPPPPTPSPTAVRPGPVPLVPPSPRALPSPARPSTTGQPSPTASALALSERRPLDPAAPGTDTPGTSAPGAPPSPAASPTAARPSSAASPAADPRPSPSPAPTAGAQQVVVTLSPEGSTVPAGETVFTVTATGDAEEAPRILALRVDGEPVATDPALACATQPSAPPRRSQRATRSFTVTLPPGDHLVEAVADSGCSWYRGRGRTSRTVTAR